MDDHTKDCRLFCTAICCSLRSPERPDLKGAGIKRRHGTDVNLCIGGIRLSLGQSIRYFTPGQWSSWGVSKGMPAPDSACVSLH